MPKTSRRRARVATSKQSNVSVAAGTENLLLAALERGDESLETGRYIVTYRDQATDEGIKSLKSKGFRLADARDFKDQAVTIEDVGDADALMFPEIGVALVSSAAMASRGLGVQGEETPAGGPIEAIEPEYFVFANDQSDSAGLCPRHRDDRP
jgi:subtilisin